VPYVSPGARAAKNKKGVDQPVPKEFVDEIHDWLPQEGRLWTRLACQRAAEMIGGDLDRAKITRENEQGVIDFHSLRGYYVTQLCKSIRNPKLIQTLARHSSMELTMRIYAKVNPSDAATAINGVQTGTKKLNKLKQRETDRNRT
jgi:integrase